MDKYVHLDLFPDARATLSALKGQKLAILSNGSPDMLNAVVRNNGLDKILEPTISIDSKRIFKPSPQAYALIESCLGVKPDEVLFVSSNPFDVCGAKAFGLKVAWIERVTPVAMAIECRHGNVVGPSTMYKAMRTQMDELGLEPDHRIDGLGGLAALMSA
jgi:2-haloacid dehalogenase